MLWLWELSERGDIVEGAACDNTPLQRVNIDQLACDQVEWAIIIGCVGGIIVVIIIIVIIAVIVKYCSERRRSAKYIQCDYLQYNTNVMKQSDDILIPNYMHQQHHQQPSPGHQIYAEIDKYSPYLEHSDQIYYSVQDPGPVASEHGPVYSSTSASTSSDQNTSSTETSSIPLRYNL